MGFTPLATIPNVPWDTNTDEQQNVFGGAGTFAYTVPHQCYYVIFSRAAGTSEALFVSSDAADTNSGLLFGSNPGNPRLRMPVVPGTVIQIHAAGAVTLNITQFYNDELT